MRNFIRSLALVAMTGAAALPVAAMTPGDFYTALLRRGVASYDAGRYEESRRLLSTAAFGFVDAVPQYEFAQLYLALTFDRLGDRAHAAEAARRLVIADRIGHSYTTLTITPETRTAFETLAAQLLTPPEFAALTGRDAPARAAAQSAEPKAAKPEARAVSPPKKAAPKRSRAATRTTETRTVKPPEPPSPSTASPDAMAPSAPDNAPSANGTPSPAAPLPESAPSNHDSHSAETGAPAAATPATMAASSGVAPQASPATTTRSEAPTAATKVETAVTTAQQSAAPQSVPPPPAPAPAAPKAVQTPVVDIDRTLSAATLALRERRLTDAQQCYRQLIGIPLPRPVLLQVAEGLYRSRDFQGVLTAFRRLEPLQRGEEPYRFYQAVAYYENGQFVAAKRELEIALAFIANTPDVARYRAKIEAAK